MKNQNTELRELIGSIVLSTQQVEQLLKFSIPFIGTDDRSWDEVLKQFNSSKKHTFGQLVGHYSKLARFDDSGDYEKHLESLVQKRNGIVHHFSELYSPTIEAGNVESVIDELKQHLRNLTYFMDAQFQLVSQLLRLLCDVNFENSPDLRRLYEQLCAKIDSINTHLPTNR